MKFKKGDRVQYIKKGNSCQADVGKAYTILEITMDFGLEYQLGQQYAIAAPWCREDQLRIINSPWHEEL